MNFFEKIYEQVKRIPRGRVATYGQIAAMSGNPHASQIVGYALHANPQPGVIPCHRVVNRFGGLSGSFAFGGWDAQAQLLADEGVLLREDGTVDLMRYGWNGEDAR